MSELVDSLTGKIPAALHEVCRLGWTLNQRAADVLAYFDRPGTSTFRPRPSTAGWSICAGPTTPSITSPGPYSYSRPECSDPDYTLNREKPFTFMHGLPAPPFVLEVL